jgi:hypothetical protein
MSTLTRMPNDNLKAKGMMASMLSGATLLVGAIIVALGIYFRNWPGSILLFVFLLGYIAYLIGSKIEGRNGSRA